MISNRFSTAIAIICVVVGTLMPTLPPEAVAAEPSSGTLSVTQPVLGWKGPEKTSAGVSPVKCGDPGFYCDRFALKVDVADASWTSDTEGVMVRIAWTDPAALYRVCIRPAGTDKFSCDATTPDDEIGKLRMFLKRATGTYDVEVRYESVVQGFYTGTAEIVTDDRKAPEVVFLDDSNITFAPATIVTPHFLGTEPMMEMERVQPGAPSENLNADRIFVTWPMGSSTQIGQLGRSEDGGDSFRLLFDMACASRTRPNCGTGGGGDTDVAVDPSNGHVYFADLEFPRNVAIASSETHGDTFPTSRESSVTNTMGAIDRQWLTGVPKDMVAIDDDRVAATPPRPLEAFVSYHAGLITQTVQGIDAQGRPIPQPIPQIVDRSTSKGPLRLDTSNGPGRGWLYLPTGNADQRYGVATVKAENYQIPAGQSHGWRISTIAQDSTNISLFSWLDLDAAGNAYTVYVQEAAPRELSGETVTPWTVRYSYSDIHDPRNNPETGGWPGTVWSQPTEISLPNATTIFPEIVGGDRGRVAVTYLAAENFHGDSERAPADTRWTVHAAIVTNALANDGSIEVRTGQVSHRVVHTGPICRGGTSCEVDATEEGADRSLADMIDIDVDSTGRVGVVFGDNNSGFAFISGSSKDKPFPHFSKQVEGPSLLAGQPPVSVQIAQGSRLDRSGDSTWPNAANGWYLPALDVAGAALELEGTDLVARIELTDASSAGMTRDLKAYRDSYPAAAPRAERLQYMMRFLTDDDIFHLSMEHGLNSSPRFFAGKLGDNDRLAAAGGEGTFATQGAGYHTDPDIPVTGSVEGNTLVLRAPAERFGLGLGSSIYSATAFALGGPLEKNETSIQNIMRTIDSNPPFDATLSPSGDPTEEPTATPTTEPTEEPSPEPSSTPTPDPTPSPTSSPPPDAFAHCDILGTDGNDFLPGTSADETICGLGGSDVLVGSGGNDVLIGGAGHDRLFGEDDDDVLRGGRGSDELMGGAGVDLVVGGRSADELRGGADADVLRGGRDSDLLRGGSGADLVMGGPNDDVLRGGRDADDLRGGRGFDRCRGGHGRDRTSHCEP